MEKKNRTVIPGPPGTGKTYRLLNHYMAKEIKENKTDPKKICYITFSKAAAEEATERFEELFPKEKLGYIGTMHALGVRELNIDVSAKLLRGNSQWNQFKLYEPMAARLNTDMSIDSITGKTRFKDPILTTRDYAKNKKISLNEAAIQKGMAGWSDIHIAEKIDGALTQYKKDTGVIEFYDMIGLFTDKIKTKDSFYDVIFLDEAQDLNALQWDMFFELEKLSNRSFIAGDDDQTIYGFQGADASTFINLEGTIDEQVKSRRVPRSVHRVALNILDRLNERRTKNWEARDEEGEVNYETSLENIDFSKGKWMILGRTNKLCEKARDHLYMKGLRYEFTGDKYLDKNSMLAFTTWKRLNNGASIDSKDVKVMYSFLKVKLGHIQRGFASGKTLDSVFSVTLEELKKDHGLLVEGSWEHLDFDEDTKIFMKHLIQNNYDLMKEADIKIMTLHGSKGKECENVVLFTDFGADEYQSNFIEGEFEKSPDNEHRLFFVGVTRAKQKLYLLQSEEGTGYVI